MIKGLKIHPINLKIISVPHNQISPNSKLLKRKISPPTKNIPKHSTTFRNKAKSTVAKEQEYLVAHQ